MIYSIGMALSLLTSFFGLLTAMFGFAGYAENAIICMIAALVCLIWSIVLIIIVRCRERREARNANAHS